MTASDMELLSFAAGFGLAGVFATLLLIWRSYFPAYLAEKGKSRATREDIEHLTQLAEGAKSEYAVALERQKATLMAEGNALERKRRSYEEICAGLRVFITGHNTSGAQDRFLSAYASSWLWASDDVLSALNQFLRLQIHTAAAPGSVPEAELKRSYVEIIVAMRKDSGFPTTPAAAPDYQFVFFGQVGTD